MKRDGSLVRPGGGRVLVAAQQEPRVQNPASRHGAIGFGGVEIAFGSGAIGFGGVEIGFGSGAIAAPAGKPVALGALRHAP